MTKTRLVNQDTDLSAAGIDFTPDGSIAATNVQAAIVEVRDEASGSGISQTIVDAKGDLIVATAADTVARQAVGTDGFVLTADSSLTNGIKWAAGGSGAPSTAQYLVGALDGGLSAEKVRADLYKNYHPDNYPTSGLTLSDEFDDSSLDGAWTWTTAPAGTVSESQFPGYLHIDGGTDNVAVQRYLRRAFVPGAAAFSVAAKVAMTMENGNFTGNIGIAVLDSGDADIYNVLLASDGTTTGSKAVRIGSTPATLGPWGPAMALLPFIYLLITRSAANVYQVWFSGNGMIWHRAGGSTVATTVSKVGIRYGIDTDSNQEEGLIDFVRVFSSETRKIGA